MPDFNADFLTDEQLAALGIHQSALAGRILIHKTAVVRDFRRMHFDGDARIDPFCVITCDFLSIGQFVHIGAGSSISGAGSVLLGNFVNISHGCHIFTSNDDYSGLTLTYPTVPHNSGNVSSQDVAIGEYSILGSGSIVLPGVTIGQGACLGALSLAKTDLSPWQIHAGVPAKRIGERDRKCMEAGARLLQEKRNANE